LLDDPMAELRVDGASLDTVTQAEGTVDLTGTSTPTQVQLRYLIDGRSRPDDVIEAAVVAARQAGWSVPDPIDGRARGSKILAAGPATLEVFVDRTAIPPRLVVRLEVR
jgi:hypothetical protein